ncbi:MAG TPA: V4R domain-containing protein [Gemmatimonadaceae bacterium]
MLTLTRASLLSLRAALLRSGDAQATVALQEAGYAGGTALFEAFQSWLAARTDIAMPDLDVESFESRLSEFFRETGWGTVHIGSIDDVVATLDSSDWGECDMGTGMQHPSCHLTTGMFADLFGRLADAPVAVLEVECRSAGHERCRFLVGSPDILDAVYDEMGHGLGYEEAVRLQGKAS